MVCPAVVPSQMALVYMDEGTECRVQLSFSVHGAEPKVALRLRHANGKREWSGWHGSWANKHENQITVRMHWRGARSPWLHCIELVKVNDVVYLWDKWGKLILMHVHMITHFPARKMLADEDSWTLL